jgi:hypothetical protein
LNEYDIPRSTESITEGSLAMLHIAIQSVIIDDGTKFLGSSLANEHFPPVSVINHSAILNNVVLNKQVLQLHPNGSTEVGYKSDH